MRADNPVIIRKADKSDVHAICDVLSEAFIAYKRYYTEKAYKATVLSPSIVRRRLADEHTSVLVAMHNHAIVGTASITRARGSLHIRSMGVSPKCQRQGVGWSLLEEISRLAKQEGFTTISLECFEPLSEANSLYGKFGFKRTGRSRKYHGITIFEMTKTT